MVIIVKKCLHLMQIIHYSSLFKVQKLIYVEFATCSEVRVFAWCFYSRNDCYKRYSIAFSRWPRYVHLFLGVKKVKHWVYYICQPSNLLSSQISNFNEALFPDDIPFPRKLCFHVLIHTFFTYFLNSFTIKPQPRSVENSLEFRLYTIFHNYNW